VGAGEIADAHQELADDLAAGKAKGLLEELNPFFFGPWMVRLEPSGEGSMAASKLQDGPRIGDGRLDLEPVADDPGISHEALDVPGAKPRDHCRIESSIGRAKRRLLLENGEPGQPGLVDLQHQPLEQRRVFSYGKAVLGGMIRPVPLMSRCYVAVGVSHWVLYPQIAGFNRLTDNS
jgi:hypothetical protein